MFLLIDLGNTRIKSALCNETGELSRTFVVPHKSCEFESALTKLKHYYLNEWNTIKQILVSNVRPSHNPVIKQTFLSLECKFLETQAHFNNLTNGYAAPEQMGVDRWIAMIAARHTWSNCPLLVVDCGTAITIDLIESDGKHRGGYILPGISTQKDALLGTTERVYADQFDDNPSLSLGLNTKSCVRNGILSGVCSLIQQTRQQNSESEEMVTVVTGGDADLIYPLLINDLPEKFQRTYKQEDLILRGIAQIAVNQ